MANAEYTRPDEDARVAQTRQLCLAAARELLVGEGMHSVRPTRISEMTGVSRSTIHRHWLSMDDLVFEATALDTDRRAGELTNDVRADLINLLYVTKEFLESDLGVLTAAQIAAAEHNDAAHQRLTEVAEARRAWMAETAQDDDVDGFSKWISVLAGPLFYRRLVTREAITTEYIEWLVDNYLAARAGGFPPT